MAKRKSNKNDSPKTTKKTKTSKCPHCNEFKVDGVYCLADSQQGMYRTEPEELCKSCANDMASSCRNDEEVLKIS